jgi:cytochrome c5
MRKVFVAWACALALFLGTIQVFAGNGEELVRTTCTRCHDLGRVRAAFAIKDRAAWSATVARMLAKPAAPAVSHEEYGAIIDWLADQK